jgi:putative transposase
MGLDGQEETVKFLVRDRDTKFTAAFDEVLHVAHIRILKGPVQAPRANAIMERWIGECRRELLNRTLIWDHRHLQRVLRDYEIHHNEHRPHRSLGQAAPLKPVPGAVADLDAFRARRHDLIGGVIHEYAQAA